MKKSIILIIIVILLGGIYYWKTNSTTSKVAVVSNSTSIEEITDADKSQIADALIEGRDLFRSGNVNEIRKYLVASKPDKKFDQLPDSAIQSLSTFLVNNKENFTREDVLASTKWGVSNGRVYVMIDKGTTISRLEAVKVDGKWYRY